MTETADSPITEYHLFPSPASLMAEVPLPPAAAASVARGRDEVRAVLNGTDDRLLVITGPCSVHDPEAALEYADRLAGTGLAGELLIVMRAYFDKPRTVTGWTGLLNDPGMDGGHDIRRGLREARRLLSGIAALGVPAACEWVSPVIPHYLADAVTWSRDRRPDHRKPGPPPARVQPADAGRVQERDRRRRPGRRRRLRSRGEQPHVPRDHGSRHGRPRHQPGNPDCHVVLRGGRSGPNFDRPSVAKALDVIEAAGLPRRVVIDASHGNSRKDHRRQPSVALTVAEQVADGERGIAGVMLESFLVAGRQDPGDPAGLVYGQSVTDSCMDFPITEALLEILADAVLRRRRGMGASR